ncbi:MAG: P27 family phage terminase small subunit [Thioclava sp.]|nr:P27 family phage terminase small subunit [Thioclava sp.]MBD3803570.1 P27 family phage terminase small subunit [Thioclava sp.]
MKGRKPTSENVVPMRDDAIAAGHNAEERARAKLAEVERLLEPYAISSDLRAVFRRLALPLCHPTRDRLNDGNLFMFIQLCRVVLRHERLLVFIEEEGEVYSSDTRNGIQHKTRPEVGQVNETFRQIRALGNEFGMTPAAERALTGGGQLGFNFGEGGADFLT